jgi:hypothetical protein
MFEHAWEHLVSGFIFIGKLLFWQWYKLTKRLIAMDIQLTSIELSLKNLIDEHRERQDFCGYQEELAQIKALLDKIDTRH